MNWLSDAEERSDAVVQKERANVSFETAIALRDDLPRALALCRTLGEALAAFTKEWTFGGHTNVHSHGAWVNCQECDSEWPCPTERIRAALSEFRSAVGEEPT